MSDSKITYNLLLIILFLCFSVFFCISKAALFSLSRHQKDSIVKDSGGITRFIERLLKNPYRLITTVLFGGEASKIAFSAAVGLAMKNYFMNTSEQTLSLLSLAVASPVLLLIAEIGPKTVGFKFPKGIGKLVSAPVYFFHLLLTPLRWVLITLLFLITKLLGASVDDYEKHRGFIFEELQILVDIGGDEGVLNEVEKNLAERFFKLEEVSAHRIMTQNIDCFILSRDTIIEKAIYGIKKRGYSRTPVYSGDRDNIVGVLYSKDLLTSDISRDQLKTQTVNDYLKSPYFIPRTKLAYDLLKEFQTKRIHMAVVVDEYGRFDGLVTMEDILEELFGEIEDERRVIKKTEVRWEGESLIVPGSMKIDEFNENYLFTVARFGGLKHLAETLEESELPSREEHETIAGFVFDLFGRFPILDEKISYGGLTFTINQIMKKRLSEIKIEFAQKGVADVA